MTGGIVGFLTICAGGLLGFTTDFTSGITGTAVHFPSKQISPGRQSRVDLQIPVALTQSPLLHAKPKGQSEFLLQSEVVCLVKTQIKIPVLPNKIKINKMIKIIAIGPIFNNIIKWSDSWLSRKHSWKW